MIPARGSTGGYAPRADYAHFESVTACRAEAPAQRYRSQVGHRSVGRYTDQVACLRI